MNQLPHTPGPWKVGSPPHGDCRIYAETEAHAIARTYGPALNGIGVCELTGPQNRADAKLIAAAPEMAHTLLDMLLAILAKKDGFPDSDVLLESAVKRAADALTEAGIFPAEDKPTK